MLKPVMSRFAKWSVVSSLVCLLSAVSFAADKPADNSAPLAPQAVPELLERKTPKMTTIVKLNHIKPALMAFWLAPKNFVNPEPMLDCVTGLPASQQSHVYSSLVSTKNLVESPPQGTDSIVSIDAQSTLLVRATKEAVEQIQQLVAVLDVPRQRVQADVTLYQISRERLEKLIPTDKPADALSRVFPFRDSEQKIVDAAIAEGQAKTLAMPKLITHNNQQICTELTSASSEEKQTFGLSLIPTVNGDGTLTIYAQPLVRLSKSTQSDAAPLLTEQKVATVFVVRDGDTMALALSSKEEQKSWLYLITPRLMKEKLEAPLK